MVIPFGADVRVAVDGPRTLRELLAVADEHLPGGSSLVHSVQMMNKVKAISM